MKNVTESSSLQFKYALAGRLAKIKEDAAPTHNVLETYPFGANRSRLANSTSGQTTYYPWGGNSVIQEYTEATGTTTPVYSKAYVYAGSRLLSTATNISGSELVEFHHPDRLGTKVVTNPSANSSYEQSTLPFGTELPAEEAGTISTNQQFTSYDRGGSTGLDYAVNRTYSSGQGRFAQVDPIGMAATSRTNPQSLNLYSYTQNNPINFLDPSGLNMIICETYVYGKEYKFSDGTVIRIPEGTYTICEEIGGGGGGGSPQVEPSGGGGAGSGGRQPTYVNTSFNNAHPGTEPRTKKECEDEFWNKAWDITVKNHLKLGFIAIAALVAVLLSGGTDVVPVVVAAGIGGVDQVIEAAYDLKAADRDRTDCINKANERNTA
jgi:RHS repeat-associated protein